MVFSSYVFVFLFLPVTLIGYYSLSKLRELQKIFLVIVSLYFYGYFNTSYLFIIVSSILINYLAAKVMEFQLKNNHPVSFLRVTLTMGILFNIALLGYFKYYDFFAQNINMVFGTDFLLKNIILPLGISFFTFQQLAFLISIYSREEKLEGFINYCVFILFFPQLVAGPIVLYREMMPQFTEEKRRYLNFDNIARGLYVFVIGLFKKVVIADTLALFVDNGFSSTEPGFVAAWIAAISYTFQIYFDFSGYSDMAIGLGKMFNIDIPQNFNSPYKSDSVTTFWRRWHITLGRFLTSYVYVPLGGNRKGNFRTCINLIVTFLVSGLWHGASWTFVLWGALHGIVVVFERVFGKLLVRIPHALRVAGTLLVINFLWVLFRAESVGQALTIYNGMMNIRNIDIISAHRIFVDGVANLPLIVDLIHFSVLIVGLLILVLFSKNTAEEAEAFSTSPRKMILTALMLTFSVIHFSRESVFIYFNF